MKILATGANGYIGANVIRSLMNEHDVTCMVRDSCENVPQELKIIKHDLRSPIGDIGPFDMIIHMAANPSSKSCIDNPESAIQDNIVATFNVLEFARKINCKKIIFFSSCEVYGEGYDSREEDMLKSFNMYGASKVACEHMCSAYYHTYGFETCVIIRLTNSWGPFCQAERFPSIIQKRFETEDTPHFILETNNRRRWIHTTDVTRKLKLLLDFEGYDTFNFVGDENITLVEFISKFGSRFSFDHKLDNKLDGYKAGNNANGDKLDTFINSVTPR